MEPTRDQDQKQLPHALQGPHRRRLTSEQAADVRYWLARVGDLRNLSVGEVAEFVGRYQPVTDALIRSATSASTGRMPRSVTLPHAIALLGTVRTQSRLREMAGIGHEPSVV